jgi:hypothetical protein
LPQAYILHKRQQKNSIKRHEAILNSPKKVVRDAEIITPDEKSVISGTSASSSELSNRKNYHLKKI